MDFAANVKDIAGYRTHSPAACNLLPHLPYSGSYRTQRPSGLKGITLRQPVISLITVNLMFRIDLRC